MGKLSLLTKRWFLVIQLSLLVDEVILGILDENNSLSVLFRKLAFQFVVNIFVSHVV